MAPRTVVNPDEVAKACQLVRAAGYAVVTKTQAEMWDAWLTESHRRETEAQDELTRYMQELAYLVDRTRELLEGRRPQWWRGFIRDYNQWDRNRVPVVGPEPATDRPNQHTIRLLALAAAVRRNDPREIRYALKALDGVE
jgi:hypothetical protein